MSFIYGWTFLNIMFLLLQIHYFSKNSHLHILGIFKVHFINNNKLHQNVLVTVLLTLKISPEKKCILLMLLYTITCTYILRIIVYRNNSLKLQRRAKFMTIFRVHRIKKNLKSFVEDLLLRIRLLYEVREVLSLIRCEGKW